MSVAHFLCCGPILIIISVDASFLDVGCYESLNAVRALTGKGREAEHSTVGLE